MREIKFRAWDSQSNKMYFGDDVIAYGDDTFVVLNDKGEPSTGHAYLMQFTGLHDKNGKEVYEGDIISFRNTKYEVVYRLGAFGIISRGLEPFATMRGISIIDGQIDKTEVIGNIYENPELLK